MKLKLKTIIIFCITFLVLIYPVYKFTSFKILQFNENEDLETFDINTFIKLKNFSQKFNKISKLTNNINQNIFKGKKVINFIIEDVSINIVGLNYLNYQTFSNNNNIKLEKIFYLPLETKTLFEPFLDLQNRFQNSKFTECNKIKKITATLRQIDDTDYILSSRIAQTRTNDTEKEKIFKKCLPETPKESIKIFINEIYFLNTFKKQGNLNLLENFITVNKNLFANEDIEKKFRDEINKIQQIFFDESSDEIIEYYFNKPYNYKAKKVYKKDFSFLNVSIIMTLMLNVLIFYVLYFLRIRLKFLNIIF